MIHLVFFTSLIFTVLAHEAGHLFMALLWQVKVEAFCVGFFRPYLHKMWKGIDWRITPWLFGGYVKLSGETTTEYNGLLSQPYYKKCLIILAGVFVNLTIAFICYWINYKDIFLGLYIDWVAVKSAFTGEYDSLINLIIFFKPNLFFLQLSMINIFCVVTNLFIWPGLDGSYLLLYLMEPVWKENYVKYLNIITKIGFWSLMVLQTILIIWIFIK